MALFPLPQPKWSHKRPYRYRGRSRPVRRLLTIKEGEVVNAWPPRRPVGKQVQWAANLCKIRVYPLHLPPGKVLKRVPPQSRTARRLAVGTPAAAGAVATTAAGPHVAPLAAAPGPDMVTCPGARLSPVGPWEEQGRWIAAGPYPIYAWGRRDTLTYRGAEYITRSPGGELSLGSLSPMVALNRGPDIPMYVKRLDGEDVLRAGPPVAPPPIVYGPVDNLGRRVDNANCSPSLGSESVARSVPLAPSAPYSPPPSRSSKHGFGRALLERFVPRPRSWWSFGGGGRRTDVERPNVLRKSFGLRRGIERNGSGNSCLPSRNRGEERPRSPQMQPRAPARGLQDQPIPFQPPLGRFYRDNTRRPRMAAGSAPPASAGGRPRAGSATRQGPAAQGAAADSRIEFPAARRSASYDRRGTTRYSASDGQRGRRAMGTSTISNPHRTRLPETFHLQRQSVEPFQPTGRRAYWYGSPLNLRTPPPQSGRATRPPDQAPTAREDPSSSSTSSQNPPRRRTRLPYHLRTPGRTFRAPSGSSSPPYRQDRPSHCSEPLASTLSPVNRPALKRRGSPTLARRPSHAQLRRHMLGRRVLKTLMRVAPPVACLSLLAAHIYFSATAEAGESGERFPVGYKLVQRYTFHPMGNGTCP